MSDEFNTRILVLEQWKSQVQVERAAESVGIKNLDRRLEDIESSLKWLNRSFWGAVLTVVVLYGLKGGFVIT